MYAAQVTKNAKTTLFDDQLLTSLPRLHYIQDLTIQKPAYTPVYAIYIPFQHIASSVMPLMRLLRVVIIEDRRREILFNSILQEQEQKTDLTKIHRVAKLCVCGAKEQSFHQPVLGHVSSTRTCMRLIKSPKTTVYPFL